MIIPLWRVVVEHGSTDYVRVGVKKLFSYERTTLKTISLKDEDFAEQLAEAKAMARARAHALNGRKPRA